MAEVKMTQKKMFNEIIALAEEAGREDIVEFAKGGLRSFLGSARSLRRRMKPMRLSRQ